MERRHLSTSGLQLPVVGMGTWKTFDVIYPEEIAQRKQLVDVALAHGSNLFDSSPMYGAAERVLPLDAIGPAVRKLLGLKSRVGRADAQAEALWS